MTNKKLAQKTSPKYLITLAITGAAAGFLLLLASMAGTPIDVPTTSSQLLVHYAEGEGYIEESKGGRPAEFQLTKNGVLVYKDFCKTCGGSFQLKTVKLSKTEIDTMLSKLRELGVKNLKAGYDHVLTLDNGEKFTVGTGDDQHIYYDDGSTFVTSSKAGGTVVKEFSAVENYLKSYVNPKASNYSPTEVQYTIRELKKSAAKNLTILPQNVLAVLGKNIKAKELSLPLKDKSASDLLRYVGKEKTRTFSIGKKYYRVGILERFPAFTSKESLHTSNEKNGIFSNAQAVAAPQVHFISFLADNNVDVKTEPGSTTKQTLVNNTEASANQVRSFYFKENGLYYSKAATEFVQGKHNGAWYQECHATCSEPSEVFRDNVISDLVSINKSKYGDKTQEWVIQVTGSGPFPPTAYGMADTISGTYAVVFLDTLDATLLTTANATMAQATSAVSAHELGHVFGLHHPEASVLDPTAEKCLLGGFNTPDLGGNSIMGTAGNFNFPNHYTCDIHWARLRSGGPAQSAFTGTEDSTKPPIVAPSVAQDYCGLTVTWGGITDNSRVRYFVVKFVEHGRYSDVTTEHKVAGDDWSQRNNPEQFRYKLRHQESATQSSNRKFDVIIYGVDAGGESGPVKTVKVEIPGIGLEDTPTSCQENSIQPN